MLLLSPVNDDLRLLGETHAESSERRCDFSRDDAVEAAIPLVMLSLSVLVTRTSAFLVVVLTTPGVLNVDKLSEILVEEGEVYSVGSM